MKVNPLETALAAKRPIDDPPREPLAVELLLTEAERRTDDAELEEFLTELRDVERAHRP